MMNAPAAVLSSKTTKTRELELGAISMYEVTENPVLELPLDKFGSQDHVFILPAIDTRDHMKLERHIYRPDGASCHVCNIAEAPLTKFDIIETIYQLIVCQDCLEGLRKDIDKIETEDIVSTII